MSNSSQLGAMSYDVVLDGDPIYRSFFTREFMNFGYWACGAATRTEASIHLMDRLVEAGLPNDARVLDVACGLGHTTRYLSHRPEAPRVLGINLSLRQLVYARDTAPKALFALMDAPVLALAPASCDVVVCVEAAFHFDTRATFLRECHRVLAPKGTLLITDLLPNADGYNIFPYWKRSNYVSSLEDYRALATHAGFSAIQLVDITAGGLRSYVAHMYEKIERDRTDGICTEEQRDVAAGLLAAIDEAYEFNLICRAVRD